MPATVIDPDFGYIDLDFTPGKPEVADPDFVVDVYQAVEQYEIVQKKYLKELEDAGRQADASRGEIAKRWAAVAFAGNPAVDPARFSVAACTQALQVVLSKLAELKKNGSGSTTPG